MTLPLLVTEFVSLFTTVDGNWADWDGFGDCNVTCGDGKRKSTRKCENPAPQNGGRDCEGPAIRYEECGEPKKCPGKI